MKTINIYINYVGGEGKDTNDSAFGKRIGERLRSYKPKVNVVLYSDLKGDISDWETDTISAIDGADIVIPILSADYLSFVSENISEKFDSLINSKDRYLFPVYLSESDWSSFNWVVRSRLFPSDSKPLLEYSEKDIDKILSDLIKTVGNVINKFSEPVNVSAEPKKNILDQNVERSVFISHDHEDADFAELLKLKLEKEGLIAWIDTERLKIGQDWREEIDIGISNSLAIIAIMTPEARKSEYVTYEWAYAWGKDKKIFPIMLKQTQLHPRLESLQYLDFTNRTNRPWDKLLTSLKELYK